MVHRLLRVFGAAAVVAGLVVSSGCAYSGVATTQDNLVVIPRNDMFLFGALRKVYVCQVTPGGVMNCQRAESP
jgi:hypothetical protein